MRIAILQTGHTNPAMDNKYKDYPALFTDMFSNDCRATQHSFTAVAVVDGKMPPTPDTYDAYIITGSKHGVYDDLP